MTTPAALLRRARFRAVNWLSTRPGLYYGMRRLSGRTDPLCVRRDSAIVIEGYPRSANSTTVHKFLELQERSMHVAHHKHHAAQILRAIRWNLPAVVLIRPPRAACLSMLALSAEAKYRLGRPACGGLAFSDVISAYVAFYEAVEPHLNAVVIGRFESVREDIAPLVRRVNAVFGTDFRPDGAKRSPQPELGWHAMPNEVRNRIKTQLSASFDSEVAVSQSLQHLLARAEAVYGRYIEADERAG